ncbi:D-alanine--D-alanine ligase [Brevirhabdus pacifica]|uniref:D-alanine--D-alanine ligase n=1 Tax=Brevirhabdus pacifica TaxID=1267768 RepID=A0A1U7DKW7_9RHOB|nr:D-alanine--D-alanine ligase [Brevirhabdus pacifica]OWU78436.1 D-alanine--D-alanine ligase [Loktanella sp. 22II-4b]
MAVVMGGSSAERDVSLSSGRECAKALKEAGYRVEVIDAGPDLVEQLRAAKPDVVFNALHGRWGEDGCVQGVLEWLRIPYTHSGVLSSALAMDKIKAKEAYEAAGLPVAQSRIAGRDEIEAGHVLPPPYVVKPVAEGSSVGVFLIMEESDAPPRLNAEMPERLMVETFVPGRELTTTVMGDRALAVTEILTDGWYDYDAKYVAGGSRHEVPADLPPEITQACLDYALRAHECLGCRGVSRTDFRWDPERGLAGLFLLETNTQPGMTPTSLVPEQAAHLGISFPELVRWMVEDASCNR